MESLAARVAACPRATVDGTWQRHVGARRADQALDGRRAYGRWGTADGFPVLYLGAPTGSVIVEAYRHLVEPVEGPIDAALAPRVLVTCTVEVTDVLDLRRAGNRLQVGLALDDLQCDVDDSAAYARCQGVAQVAHQLGCHGIIAPAATRLGETLALFPDLLPADQRPVRSSDDELWSRLPADPRLPVTPRLRLVQDED